MSDLLSKIVDGVAAVAPMAANLVVPGSGALVHTLMRKITGAGPDMPIEQVAEKIAADPALYIELQKSAMEHEARLAEIDASKLDTVNVTMREESQSEHWPQYSWRPFNGFTYPLAVLLIYFALPLAGKAVPSVPDWIWIGWLSILGVATWDRGKQKRIEAGEKNTGLIAKAISAIRGGNG